MMAEPVPMAQRSPPPRLLGWITQVGFTLAFAIVALVFGVWFGVQLLRTQTEGITAINQIQDVEYAQAQQMAETNQRLEATQETLRVTNDRLDRLTEQLAALTRLAVLQRPEGEAP